MRKSPRRRLVLRCMFIGGLIAFPPLGRSQEPAGPQTSAPAPVAPPQPAAAPKAAQAKMIRIPAGTRVAVVLENGISTRGAKAGDSVYFHTSFPITQNNHIIIP